MSYFYYYDYQVKICLPYTVEGQVSRADERYLFLDTRHFKWHFGMIKCSAAKVCDPLFNSSFSYILYRK